MRERDRMEGFVSALVTVTIRTSALHFSTITSNKNPHFRQFDRKSAAVQGDAAPGKTETELKTSRNRESTTLQRLNAGRRNTRGGSDNNNNTNKEYSCRVV